MSGLQLPTEWILNQVQDDERGCLLSPDASKKNVFLGLSENAEKGGGGSERKRKNFHSGLNSQESKRSSSAI